MLLSKQSGSNDLSFILFDYSFFDLINRADKDLIDIFEKGIFAVLPATP